MIILKGHPTKMSEEIELPDISELLMYPYFLDTDLDSAYKNGTWFQRKLIDMCEINKNKKHYSLRSHVQVLIPHFRSCTGGGGRGSNPDFEWHIDNEERENAPGSILHEDRDIVTLLTNKTHAMTVFNKNEIQINLEPEDIDIMKFVHKNFQAGNPLGIEPWEMPANRLVTFTNHLHRPTPPSKLEFRYMFRLVQTDRERPSPPYMGRDASWIMDNGNRVLNIERSGSSVEIKYPNNFRDFFLYK